MSLPLSIFLIPYGLFLIFYVAMGLSFIYHLLRYGYAHFFTYVLVISFLAISFVILSWSFYLQNGIKWGETFHYF